VSNDFIKKNIFVISNNNITISFENHSIISITRY